MSDYKEVKYSFRPVKCTEDKMASALPVNGYIYLTTDTQKLFLGHENKFMEMCAAKGFYYGQKNIEYDNSGNEPDPVVDFYKDEIEGGKLPEVDDLILNIDGCFYRVTNILDEETVRTNRLTLQGTGGGGGGGGTGDPTANLRISQYGGSTKYFSQEAKVAELGVVAYSSDTTNYISGVECSFDNNFNDIFLSISNLTHALEKPYYVNIASQLSNISSRGTKVYLRVTDKYGSTRSVNYSVYIASLQLTTTQPTLFGITDNILDYRCVIGGSTNLDSRAIEYELYDANDRKVFSTTQELESNQIGSISKKIDISTVTHGDYTLKVRMVGVVSGTTITSNELVHKVLRYQEAVGQPIFSALIPDTAEQYTDIPIQYLLVFGDNIKSYPVVITSNGKLETTQILTAGTIGEYKLNFDIQGSYKVELSIADLSVSYSSNINVTKYTGTLPVVNIDRDDLEVYLTAKGRTNNSADKDFWPDYKNGNMKGELSDFYFRSINGWLTDENGINYLKASQGAKVEFNAYSPFENDPKVNGLTIELDFKVSSVLDYSARLMECISYNSSNEIYTGFFVTGNTFNYWAGGKELVSLNIVENQRIKLSYVIEPVGSEKYPMCYTYLNGIISNVFNYPANTDFSNNYIPGYFKVDSTYGQVDVYSVRYYSSALDAQTVLNNYQATLETLEKRQESYEQNLIRNISGDIDLDLIESNMYDLQIPYVKIVGGYQSDKKFTMGEETGNIQALPVGKKDYRAIDIEVIYPTAEQNPYFKDYKNFKLTTTFDDPSLNVLNGFGHEAKTGTIMYAQGTSSLEYPVKNLRMKFKGDKIRVRPDLEPVNLVTFKADFMESSGSHNTGAANFIDAAYKNAEMSTPGQDYYSDEEIVTCIKGHPCVIFWSKTGEKGTFEYIGKYNLNLDKATPEPFGFKNDDDFGWEKDEDGNFILDEDGNKKNSIFCFEFLDNNVKVCNFLSDETSNANPDLKTEEARYYDTWYSDRVNEDKEVVPGWCIGFESRHPEDKVGLHDADALWPLASWLNSLYAIYQRELAAGLKPTDIEYTYEYTQASKFDVDETYYILNEDGTYEVAFPSVDNFNSETYYTRKTTSTTYKMESIRRFRDEYQEYLDPEFLLAYYVITEALLMADSRVKNMMIATWGKEHRTFKKIDGTEKSVYNYIWYPIFYDMDTMLGLDNIGYVNKNYYDEDTTENVFNGDEVLWKLTRDSLPNEIAQFYNRLESAKNILTKNGILPYFNQNQANVANETFYNEDAFYKYIDTFRNGYTNHLTGETVLPGAGTRLYAAQGDRAMMREYFIDNRIKYLRGKYSSTQYQSGDRIEFRLTYPKEAIATENTSLTEEDIKTNASIKAVPPSGKFDYTSIKTGFAGVKIGKNSTPTNKRFVDKQSQSIEVDTTSGNGTETYLLGVSNLSSVGDLSDKYLYKLVIGTGDNHLQDLILGNHHKDYYNPFWSEETSIELNGFNYLETFNLENCGSFTGSINFTECPQIKTILLNGSSTSSLTLPPSGILEELRIPTTVNNLLIDSHPTLAADKFTIGYFDYNTNQYVNDYSKLVHISVKNTPIDTYEIARQAVLYTPNRNLMSYNFQDVNWTIDKVEDVVIENGAITGIKLLDELHTLKPYTNSATHAESLTGTLTVDVGDYTIDEFTLYDIYNKIYPNLKIKYISSGLQKAYTINFYNSEIVLGEPYYSVLSNGSATLAYLISDEGPNGIALTEPVKVADNENVYKFSGNWVVAASADDSFSVGQKVPQTSFGNYKPEGDITFTASYTSSPREYSIVLYDDDGTTVLLEEKAYWGDDIGAKFNTKYAQLTYNYKPYTDTETFPHNRYTFKGWQSNYDFSNKTAAATWSNLSGVTVNGDFVAYAYYVVEDSRYNEFDEMYFTINSIHINNINGNSYNGLAISIKNLYRDAIQGHLTIPSKYQNQDIYFVKDFKNMTKITDVYFLDGNQYKGIYDGGFQMTAENKNNALKNVYLPKTDNFKFIWGGSFQNCHNLEHIALDGTDKLSDSIEHIGSYAFGTDNSLGIKSSLHLNELPSSLAVLDSSAFIRSGDNVIITVLPPHLTVLSDWSLSRCAGVNISVFGSENAGEGLTTISAGALYDSGPKVTEIELKQSITTLASEINSSDYAAFENYAPNLSTFTSAKSASEIKDLKGNLLTTFADAGVPAVTIVEALQEV